MAEPAGGGLRCAGGGARGPRGRPAGARCQVRQNEQALCGSSAAAAHGSWQALCAADKGPGKALPGSGRTASLDPLTVQPRTVTRQCAPCVVRAPASAPACRAERAAASAAPARRSSPVSVCACAGRRRCACTACWRRRPRGCMRAWRASGCAPQAARVRVLLVWHVSAADLPRLLALLRASLLAAVLCCGGGPWHWQFHIGDTPHSSRLQARRTLHYACRVRPAP